MSDWTPPPDTRWCLVGEPGRADGGRLYVLGESGQVGDVPCPMPEPHRGNCLSPDPADHPPAWLSPFGIGTTTTHQGGIAGYVEHLILRRATPRPAPKRKAGRSRGRRDHATAQPASPGPGAPRTQDRAGGDPRQLTIMDELG